MKGFLLPFAPSSSLSREYQQIHQRDMVRPSLTISVASQLRKRDASFVVCFPWQFLE